MARLFYALFELIGAALFALIVWFVWPNFLENYHGGYFKGTTGYIEIPLWPFRGIVVIGAAAAAIQHLLLAWRELALALESLTMPDIAIGALCLVGSLILIQSGMHIGVAMMLLSFLGVWAIKSFASPASCWPAR